ncbi:hypothetical protein RvY_16826 [Ramazzottius varieornatus]|uniref:Receptor ligand binding region domain-containing protein n=1 Tax=Ramazzottius varieornatus TaxID=947166 RepID=A0A1D1VZX8_RAMVA|nr:hypothetical protein RvY_16826 [Ramazzottius varieornatus]
MRASFETVLILLMSTFDLGQPQVSHQRMDTPKVTILSALSYQYVDIVPALHVAAEESQKLYSRYFDINALAIYRKELYTCDSMDDASVDLISSNYYRRKRINELVVLLSPKWNIPVVSLLATPLTEDRPFPTFIASAPVSNIAIYSTVAGLLRRFSWHTVFLLCDTAAAVVFYRNLCAGFKLRLEPPEFAVFFSSFDSSSGYVDYDRHLANVATSSRG